MKKFQAIQALYPNIITVYGDDAFDVDGNPVVYDEQAVQAKMVEMQQAEEQAKQNAEMHKVSAIEKLAALGLSADEIKALTGVQA